ncbi:gamma-interferon-inducible lysosomal thiol reductase-like protein isoform X2 [Lycorma delicatula]|uniref:gamma-interferon-inducible lysosomal thiol reductase-like protein isoform X2 n=1 Tax=Lycorma delicatula TaxID=130591 RepID=UPI003F518C7D
MFSYSVCKLQLLCLIACTFVVISNSFTITHDDKEDRGNKVKVTLFYETQCGDCVNYFAQQISPTYKNLKKNVVFDLVPYGKSQQNYSEGHWHFTCQHGQTECEYNELHACAIDKINSQAKLIPFLACLMQDKQEELHINECTKKYSINKLELDQCRYSTKGEDLLAKMGNRTHDFQPTIKHVPTLAFNGVYKQKDQDDAEKDLQKVVCRYLKSKPKSCKHHQQKDYISNEIV